MAQIVPANDCARRIISPKLVAVGRHLNLELHTLTEWQEVTGEEANLTVTLKKQPRYIDASKCTGCGLIYPG